MVLLSFFHNKRFDEGCTYLPSLPIVGDCATQLGIQEGKSGKSLVVTMVASLAYRAEFSS